MTNEKPLFKHGVFVLSYLLLVGIEAYFIRSVKVLYSPYLFLAVLLALGLILNFVFLFLFKNSENPFGPPEQPLFMGFALYQVIQAALAFLIACFLFHLPWKESLAYPSGALLGFVAFLLIRSELSLRNVLLTVLLALGFTISLRLSAVNGGLLFALALASGFYLGSGLLSKNPMQQTAWENVALFTGVLALGRAAIQYYLVTTGYDSLGVVITQPYTFVGLFAGFFVPIIYWLVLKDKLAGTIITFLVLGIFFPWVLGVFIHVRPFAGYLLGFVISSFIVGILFSAPRSLTLLSYLNFASGVFGLTLFGLLSNLGRGVRIAILGGLFILALLEYIIQSLIQKNKSS